MALSMKDLEAQILELKGELAESREASKAKEAETAKKIEAMGDRDFTIVNGKVAGSGIRVMSATEYREFSKSQGKTMGRAEGQVTKCSIEELRALINSKWTPSMVIEKHGMSPEELKQLVWKLSQKELRDNPIKFSIEQNFFSREA